MKSILIFNDFSPEAAHATELALLLAAQTNSSLYIWNTLDNLANPVARELAVAHSNKEMEVPVGHTGWVLKLGAGLNWKGGLLPVVKFIDEINYAPENVLSIVNKYEVGMLVKGITGDSEGVLHIEAETISCSTKSGCPVLLIPEKFEHSTFEKIVYATDLRFCPREIIAFLNQLASSMNASIQIANISPKGLPYLEDNYARTIFEETILKRSQKDQFFFSNVRERDVSRAIDVLVNGMNNDLLVLVNNRFHFNELLGHHIPCAIPSNISVPLLIFPS